MIDETVTKSAENVTRNSKLSPICRKVSPDWPKT